MEPILTEDRRNQLDSIVQQMIQNKESENDIQFVVNDFKTKYGQTEKSVEDYYPTTPVQRFMIGMGKGFTDIGRGVGERLGLVTPEEVVESRKLDQPIMQTVTGKAGNFVGSALPWMVIPGGAATSLTGRVLAGAAGGAIGGLVQPTTKEESVPMNVATGGGIGGVLPFGLAGASKVINAIKEPVKGATAELARRFNLPITLGELTGNPHMQRMESWLEEIPIIGLKRFRDRQQTQAKNAVTKFIGSYVKDPSQADWTTGGRQFASQLYQDLQQTLPGISKQNILPKESKTVAADLLDRYPDIFKKFQDTRRENLIKDIVIGTKDITKTTPASKILGTSGQPAIPATTTTTPKTLTFEEAWELRHGLGQMIGQARKKLASGDIDKSTLSQMKKLFVAINNDIDNWATSIGNSDVTQAIQSANNSYRQFVVKSDIIQRALDQKNVYTTDGFLSTQKFSNALRDIIKKDKYYGTFSKSEIEEMTGLSNIMHVIQRAGQFKENPPTGRRWGPLIFMGLLRETGEIAGLPLIAVSNFLSATESGKRLVMAASKIEPKSPAMASIIDQIYRQVPRMGAIEATKPTGRTEGIIHPIEEKK